MRNLAITCKCEDCQYFKHIDTHDGIDLSKFGFVLDVCGIVKASYENGKPVVKAIGDVKICTHNGCSTRTNLGTDRVFCTSFTKRGEKK